jgi:hypothetical protein
MRVGSALSAINGSSNVSVSFVSAAVFNGGAGADASAMAWRVYVLFMAAGWAPRTTADDAYADDGNGGNADATVQRIGGLRRFVEVVACRCSRPLVFFGDGNTNE